MEKASKGHPVYSLAHFRTATEIVGLAEVAGFALFDAASTLFWMPGKLPPRVPRIKTGMFLEAGFLALLFGGSALTHLSGNESESHG